MRRTHKKSFGLGGLLIVLLVAGGVFIGAQWVTKTGLFKVPGVVYYGESLNNEEKQTLKGLFTDEIVLDKDVKISAEYSFEKPEAAEGTYIYNIYVPVTDFYSIDEGIEVDSPENVFADAYQKEVNYEMIPVGELDFRKKLLALNGNYYLDEFDKGAVYRIVRFESERFDDEIKPLVDTEFAKQFPEKDKVLTFAQTGVTALSRGMNEKLYEVGDAKYFAEKIGGFLSSFDLTHTSNESSFSAMAGAHNICSDERFIDTLTAIGLDIVELTGNHNQDCGYTAAEDTIDIYNERQIKVVGGGKTADEAAVPLSIQEKGNNITMLAYNLSTGGATTDDTPGANQYEESKVVSDISAAKERGDYVIVDVQYYECSAYASEYEDPTCDRADSAAGDQVGLFRHLIELGADVVVGTSAHQSQTYELYEDGVIYYGLGNLFFDQVWWPGTTRSLVLAHYLYNGKLLQTKVIPTVYDSNMQTEVMGNPGWYLQRLLSVRP
ncbi:CapA family protein [Candidatus Saccharibacteria bacterium]|nr:CapA family protein [Candidatus Saccharibacteria bacterium]